MRLLPLWIVLLLVPRLASAQVPAPMPQGDALPTLPSAQIGLLVVGDAANAGGNEFVGVSGVVTMARVPYSAALRFDYATEFNLLDGSQPEETLWNAALLLGYELLRDGWVVVDVQAGPSLTGGVRRTDEILRRGDCSDGAWFCGANDTYASTSAVLPGLTGSVGLVISPFSYLGLGTHVQGTLNDGRSYGAYGFSVHVGRLR